jgi:hypothetical protein
MMDHSKPLRFTTPDSNGAVPDTNLIETLWQHTGNSVIYQLFDFGWNGADDTWMLMMASTEDEDTPAILRPLDHLEGNRDDGSKRYVQVDENGDPVEPEAMEDEDESSEDDDGQEE